MYDRDDAAPALLSFLIGGIVGASLTCLLATRSGTAPRRRIPDGAGEAPEVLIGEGIASRAEAERASASRGRKVPEPGLPTDMGGGGRG